MTSIFTLLSCGSNAQGQLGNGSLEDSHTFQPCVFADFPPPTIPNGARIIDIACGANHTLLLLEVYGHRRELWGCGDGRKGQLGLKYKQTVSATGLFHKLDLALYEASLEEYSFKAIATTWETSYVVLSRPDQKDVVLSMGSDDYGDLGVGGLEKTKRTLQDFHVVDFSCVSAFHERCDVLGIYSGQRHTILHVNSASGPILVGWGTSRHGQLGAGNLSFTPTPRIVSINSSEITTLSLGLHHTTALYTTGEALGLGSNRKRQLELVHTLRIQNHRVQDISCTWNGTYVLTRDERGWNVQSSGSNSHNQLGWKSEDADSTGKVIFPDELDLEADRLSITCGSEHVLLLEKPSMGGTERLWGWGWNEHGNLGLGHTHDIPFPTRLWADRDTIIHKVWGGLGTSWIFVEGIGP